MAKKSLRGVGVAAKAAMWPKQEPRPRRTYDPEETAMAEILHDLHTSELGTSFGYAVAPPLLQVLRETCPGYVDTILVKLAGRGYTASFYPWTPTEEARGGIVREYARRALTGDVMKCPHCKYNSTFADIEANGGICPACYREANG